MAKIPERVLVEILSPRAKPGGKADIVSTFRTIWAISNDAATSSNRPPSLGLRVFNNVETHPEEAGLFLFWESMEHHDGLSETPGFAPAAKLFGEKVVPGLETPLDPIYLWTRQGEVALCEAACCEVIEIQTSGSQNVDGLSEKLATSLENLDLGGDYLGHFYGPKYNDTSKVVVVTKWTSKAIIGDGSWAQKIEKCIADVFGQGSSIEKRRQMYA